MVCLYYYYWKDQQTGSEKTYRYTPSKKKPTKEDARKEAKAAQNKHQRSVIRRLTKDLDNPKEIAKLWRKAGKRP